MNAKLSNLECKITLTDSNNFFLKYELIYFIREEMYKIDFKIKAQDRVKNEYNDLKKLCIQKKSKISSEELRAKMSSIYYNRTNLEEFKQEMFKLNEKLLEKKEILNSNKSREIDIVDFTISLYILNKNKDWNKLTFGSNDLNLNMSINDPLDNKNPSKSYYKIIDKFTIVAKKTSEEYLRRFTPKKKAVIF